MGMNYHAEKTDTQIFKKKYRDGFETLISARQEALAEKRKEYCKNIFDNAEAYRSDLKRMLGWPLTEARDEALPRVKKIKLSAENGYTVYRLQFEILDGLELSGLYFEVDGDEKRPLVLVQHGGMGTPELVSGAEGRTHNYNDLLQRVIARGVHAFAPQLLLWGENYGVSFDRKATDARLKRLGSSISAVELHGLSRVLDYFEKQSNISSFGMVGLSYGGFYTLFLAAIDTRIRSAVSCAFFNTRDKYPWLDWCWFDAAEFFDDAEVACLVYPRKLCLEIGDKDPLFDAAYGKKSFERLKEICRNVGTDWVSFSVFDGVHEFPKDDMSIDEMVKSLFQDGLN